MMQDKIWWQTYVGLASTVHDVVLSLLKGAVVRRTVSVARHDDDLFVVVEVLCCFDD